MKRTTPSLVRRVGVLLTAVLATGVAACSATEEETGPSLHLAPRVAITSVEGDTLSELLAAIYARAMENTGVRVVRKDPVVMDRATYAQAIIDGQFQMIPDFSRELLDFIAAANPTTTVPTTEAITATTRAPITIPTTVPDTTAPATGPTSEPVTTAPDTAAPDTSDAASTSSTPDTSTPDTSSPDTSAPESSDVSSSTPTTLAPPNNSAVSSQIVSINSSIDPSLVAYTATFAEQRTVVACTQAYLERQAAYQLITLTDLASLAPSTRFAAPAAFIADDADDANGGLDALLRVYAPEFAETITIEADAIAVAVADDSADCFAVDSLDPVITAEKLTIIVDDQYMVPMNVAIALLSAASAGPEVASALDRVAGSLSTQKLNQLLREVEVKGTEIDVVANAFVDNLVG